jgi:radical SAM superfamily enzyme YgiQ (UPF0313 family)
MNIILADSHGRVLGKDQTSASLSLLYLGAYLHGHDLDVALDYIPQGKTDDYHLERIRECRPAIYASSFTSFTARETYALIRRIKAEFPDLLVVCGGAHANTHAEEILRKSGADIVAIGEGEETFLEIVQRYPGNEPHLALIKGIAFLDDEGVFRKTATRPLIDDIDTIPFPLRDLVNDDDFAGLTYSKARPNTEMVITRGCPWRCVFCANPVFRLDNGPLHRARSPANIALEVQELYERGYREIYLHSDELNVHLDWSIEVCKAIAALNFKDLYFQCNMRVVPMSEELAYWMRQANFWLVRVGIESTSDRVLKGIKKKMSFEKTEGALKMMTDQGIKVFAFMMLFNYWEENGELQNEAATEVRQTIDDVYRLWRKGLLHYTGWQFCAPVPGSEFYDIALRHGMIDEDYQPSDTWESFDYLVGVSRKEFNSLYAAARRQQGMMAAVSGNFEWRNYRNIVRKAYTMFFGQPGKS